MYTYYPQVLDWCHLPQSWSSMSMTVEGSGSRATALVLYITLIENIDWIRLGPGYKHLFLHSLLRYLANIVVQNNRYEYFFWSSLPAIKLDVLIVCKGSPRFTTINLRSEHTVIKLYCRPYWLCEINIVMSFYFLFIIPTSPPRVAL